MASPLDRDRLLKLLAMLDTDQDGEALAAARKLNKLVRESGQAWDEILALPAAKGWTSAFEFSTLYFLELKRRISAERNAEQWQAIARARETELVRLRESGAPAPQVKVTAKRRPAQETGHDLIDRLLVETRLPAEQRARVEAIASWYRQTQMLTRAEEADLETFLRKLEPAEA